MSYRFGALLVVCVGMVAVISGCGKQAGMSGGQVDSDGQLVVLNTFIAGGEGGWDDLTVDARARRVYVSRATRVMVLDADKGTVVGEIADTPGVHGIAVVDDRNLGFTSNGRENMVSVFDLKTLKTLQKIKTGQKPDAILYDPFSKRVYVFNGGSGDATIIDPAALDKPPVTLAIGGKLEFGASDGAGHVYVNIEDKGEVVVIDAKAQKITARWPVAPGTEPSGLAIDRAHRRLFVGCANQKMIILDADKGARLGDPPVGSGVDGAAYDGHLKIAVCPNGKDGTLSVIREEPAGKFVVVQTVTTAQGARTVREDVKTHRFFLPCRVPATDGSGKPQFALLVVGEKE
jgi:DNA-binding beta-propeller fold protein YncE